MKGPKGKRSGLPLGVSPTGGGKFKARVQIGGKRSERVFSTIEQAATWVEAMKTGERPSKPWTLAGGIEQSELDGAEPTGLGGSGQSGSLLNPSSSTSWIQILL